MMNQATTTFWPMKRRVIRNRTLNSAAWDEFRYRDGDIVIATYAKSGTTWMQQIVSQLIFRGVEGIEISKISPWIEFRNAPSGQIAALEQQAHRRFVKTHLPADALPLSPLAKYIYVGRDGRDAAWSFFNHNRHLTDEALEHINAGPDTLGPKLERCSGDARDFYRRWFAENGAPYWPFWQHLRSWWSLRDMPNLLLIHFNDMKRDLAGSIRRIAGFLEIPVDESLFPTIVTQCSFDYMKAHAEAVSPTGGRIWQGGAKTFMNRGTNGRWRESLEPAEVAAYEAKALAELGPECARWLAHGGTIDNERSGSRGV